MFGSIENLWLIAPAAIESANRQLVAAETLTHRDIAGDRYSRENYTVVNGIGIIPVKGILRKNSYWGTSPVDVRVAVRACLADPNILGTLLYFQDCPGGSINGIADAAADIAIHNSQKPIYAYNEDGCESAGYWMASQCRKVFSNSTGLTGSIGAVTALVDSSEAAKKSGYKVHLIKSGEFKVGNVDGVPISKSLIENVQSQVENIAAQFKAAVAKGRKFSSEKIDAIADGRSYIGLEAKAVGLIDDVCSLEDAFNLLVAEAGGGSTADTYNPVDPDIQEDIPLTLKDLKALIMGKPDDMPLAEALSGNTAASTETAPAIDASASAKVAELTAANEALQAASKAREAELQAQITLIQAQSFADSMIAKNKALPAERDSMIAAYSQALNDDRAMPGANRVALIFQTYEARSSHTLTAEAMPSGQVSIVAADTETARADATTETPMTPERRKFLIERTELGKTAMKRGV